MKKFLALSLAGIMSLTLLAACGETPAPTPTPDETTPDTTTPDETTPDETTPDASAELEITEDVTLKTVSMFGGTDPNAAVYADLIEQYKQENTKVKVEDNSQTSSEEWKATVAADFSVGNEADVYFYFTGVDATPLLEGGKVVSIDTIRAEFPTYAENISDGAMSQMVATDGKAYSVPITGFVEALFCNKTLFDEVGAELPTDWDKLMDAIAKFDAAGIIPMTAPLGTQPHYWIEHFVLATGGVEDHKVNPKSEGEIPESWVAGFELFKTLADANAFGDAYATVAAADSQGEFKTGLAAMTLEGSWFAGQINEVEKQEEVVAVAFPAAPGGKKDPTDIIAGFTSGYYITTKAWNESTSKKVAAVKFVEKLTSDESIKAHIEATGSVPATKTEISGGESSALADSIIALSAAAKGADLPIDSRLTKEAWAYMTAETVKVASGDATAAEVLNGTVALNGEAVAE